MLCDHCESPHTEQTAAVPDDAVVGGIVRLFHCGDCGKTTEDVPPEKADARREARMPLRTPSPFAG